MGTCAVGEPVEPAGTASVERDFDEFVAAVEPRLRRALVAAYGAERGADALAEALGWAWEHRDRLPDLREPVGYLFRVGQSRTRTRRRRFLLAEPAPHREPWVEPGLPGALGRLSEQQRTVVVLVHGFGWTYSEVAELLGIGTGTVSRHVERGLASLRRTLEVDDA